MKTFFFVCFALHLIFDRKNWLIMDVKIFIQDFLYLGFSESPGPPFPKSCVRYWLPPAICLRMVNHLKAVNYPANSDGLQ